jgi:hypothetical protein
MRFGTFLCWLFGHKFIGREIQEYFNKDGHLCREVTHSVRDYCVRCGIYRSKNVTMG